MKKHKEIHILKNYLMIVIINTLVQDVQQKINLQPKSIKINIGKNMIKKLHTITLITIVTNSKN